MIGQPVVAPSTAVNSAKPIAQPQAAAQITHTEDGRQFSSTEPFRDACRSAGATAAECGFNSFEPSGWSSGDARSAPKHGRRELLGFDAFTAKAAPRDLGRKASDPPLNLPHTSFDLAVVSDYRRGGMSRSGGHPAVQASIDVEFPGGWSVGIWGSTTDAKHSNFEIALYGAKEFEFGDTELTIGATAIIDVDRDRIDFGIAQASISHPVGPFDLTLAVNYAWEQSHLDDQDNLYVSLRGRTPIGRLLGIPLTLGASLGRTEGRFADDGVRLDWSTSLTADVEGTDIGFSYVDNDLAGERGDAAFVVSIAHTF